MTVAAATELWCCGIAALKPTLGRIPHATTIEPEYAAIGMQLTAVYGPLARRVADLRAAFGVLAGPTWRDPWTVPALLRGPEHSKPARVALVADPAGRGTAEQVQEGVRKAATPLEDAGYVIEEVEPPSIEAAANALLVMLSTPGLRQGWKEFMAPSRRPKHDGSCRRSSRRPAIRTRWRPSRAS